MTRTTDKERAQALAEKHGATSYRNRADTQNPAYGFTPIQLAALIAEVEQAARRAPAVPVPQGLREAAQRAHDWMDSQADSQSKGNYHSFDLLCLRQERDALAEALAAAPQAPEAAPVQMPEYGIDTANHAGVRVRGYTKQQVRELLAAHGIEVAP